MAVYKHHLKPIVDLLSDHSEDMPNAGSRPPKCDTVFAHIFCALMAMVI